MHCVTAAVRGGIHTHPHHQAVTIVEMDIEESVRTTVTSGDETETVVHVKRTQNPADITTTQVVGTVHITDHTGVITVQTLQVLLLLRVRESRPGSLLAPEVTLYK